MTSHEIHIIGGGLAGSEAALTLSRMGHPVRLSEMRPSVPTPAHRTGHLAELVCSNSLGSKSPLKAKGLLLAELKIAGAALPGIFERYSVPAGQALAVDAALAAEEVTRTIEADPNITLQREEVTRWPDAPAIIAAGPLASKPLMEAIATELGTTFLHFFDAISPSVFLDSVDLSQAFFASRYGVGGDDYLNIPLTEERYNTLVDDLLQAERVPIKEYEPDRLFEPCLPVEVIAARGHMSLAFGPLKPRGLDDPATGRRQFAVLQLRRETIAGDVYNLVGFQTRLTQDAQRRVLRKLPALNEAKFARYGMMHLNAYLDGPAVLNPDLSLKKYPQIFIAGQLAGGEGYLEAMATGFFAALNLAAKIQGRQLMIPPTTTMSGALLNALTSGTAKDFNPTQVQFGLLPALEAVVRNRKKRDILRAERAMKDMKSWLGYNGMKPQDIEGLE